MRADDLGTYLNDHMAGSMAAVALLEHAIEENSGSPWATQLRELLGGVRQDQDELRGLMDRMGFGQSGLKKAGGWLAGKIGQAKLRDTGTPDGLGRLEMLETLAMGILGKLALWRVLQRIARKNPVLLELDLARLARRAQEQHELVEAWRLEAAEQAL